MNFWLDLYMFLGILKGFLLDVIGFQWFLWGKDVL